MSLNGREGRRKKGLWWSLLLMGAALILLWPKTGRADEGQTGEFTDMPSSHWAYFAVQDMVKNGVIDGYEDNSFQPDAFLTREQFAKLLTMALDAPLLPPSEPSFSDVPAASWSYPYVETTKTYLEGYTLPIGKPFFDPGGIATRGDVAVALVKGMKLDITGIDAEGIIRSRLTDYENIPGGIQPYVAAAVQYGLIQGYEDGSFQAGAPLSRAAGVTLLQRLLASSTVPPLKDIPLSVQVPDKLEKPEFDLKIALGPETKLFLNGEEVTHHGNYSRREVLSNGEGVYRYELRAVQPNGRYKLVAREVQLTIPKPELTVKVPNSSDIRQIMVSGTVKDINDPSPAVRVNDTKVYVSGDGSWSTKVTLEKGANRIRITAANRLGKESELIQPVTFQVKPPEITLDSIPGTVYSGELKIKGAAADLNDSNPSVKINGKLVKGPSFEQTLQLTEGENTISIAAENLFGEKAVISKTVTYTILPPNIIVTSPSVSNQGWTTLRVDTVDSNDDSPSLYLGNNYMGKKSFVKEIYSLNEGANVFHIKAVNKLGKTSYHDFVVTYIIPPPELTVTGTTDTTYDKIMTITLQAADLNDSYPKLYVNGQYVGIGSYNYRANLVEGSNTFVLKATNTKGKYTEVTKVVNYVIPIPVVTVDSYPASTSNPAFILTARAADANDTVPKLYINGEYAGESQISREVTLQEGINLFEITAMNKSGKQSLPVTISITYTPLPSTPAQASPAESAEAPQAPAGGSGTGHN